jgi:hypothetical protein
MYKALGKITAIFCASTFLMAPVSQAQPTKKEDCDRIANSKERDACLALVLSKKPAGAKNAQESASGGMSMGQIVGIAAAVGVAAALAGGSSSSTSGTTPAP